MLAAEARQRLADNALERKPVGRVKARRTHLRGTIVRSTAAAPSVIVVHEPHQPPLLAKAAAPMDEAAAAPAHGQQRGNPRRGEVDGGKQLGRAIAASVLACLQQS